MERGGNGVDLSIAPGCQMARRQALHRRRCQVHLRSLDGQRQGKAAHQSAQILVCKCGGCDHQRRLRSDCSFEAAATLLPRAAGDRLVAGLPLPCLAARHAQHPIGTGPFKLIEFKPNQSITVTRNPDYWKPGRPYLDGIEYTIIKDLSTRTLAFVAGKGDLLYGVTTPQRKDIKSQAPQAICEVAISNTGRNLLV